MDYRITGYIQSKKFCRTPTKFNFEGFIFVLCVCRNPCTHINFVVAKTNKFCGCLVENGDIND